MLPEEPTNTTEPTIQTYWELLVWITFNPSNDDLVNQLKSKYAEIINLLDNAKQTQSTHTQRQRYIAIAITEAQTAQMRAVKAVTAK